MCRGLAAGYDTKDKTMICEGHSSHTKTLGFREDDCVKLEIIVTDSIERGFTVELDESYRKEEFKLFPKYVSRRGNFTKLFREIIENWIKENELQITRWLLHNQSYAKRRRNVNNRFQKSKRGIENALQKSDNSICNSFQNALFIVNRTQKAKNITNQCQVSDGLIDNANQKAGGEWFMGCLQLTKYPNTSKLIKMAKDDNNLTIVEFASFCAINHEKVKEIMGKELKTPEDEEFDLG